MNRRRINPILVKSKIRPIPRSFANASHERRESTARTLCILPEKFRGAYLYVPDPPKEVKPIKIAAVVVETAAQPPAQEAVVATA